MNIVVCVKQVPETTAKKEIGRDLKLNRAALESELNPFDEYATEEALRLKEAQGGEVTILTMGPASAEETMRKALAMGVDKGVLISDPALEGSDVWGTARVLCKAVQRLGADLVMTGMESTEARTGLVPGALAEGLGLPALTYASKVEVQEGSVRINRQVPGGYQEIESPLPALVSVVKGVNEPRYPSLRGIMAAKRKQIEKLSLADLGLEPGSVGSAGAKEQIVAATPRPERIAGEVISAPPERAAQLIADFLAQRKFI